MNPLTIFGGIIFCAVMIGVMGVGMYDEFNDLADNELTDETEKNYIKAIPAVFMVLSIGTVVIIFFRGAMG